MNPSERTAPSAVDLGRMKKAAADLRDLELDGWMMSAPAHNEIAMSRQGSKLGPLMADIDLLNEACRGYTLDCSFGTVKLSYEKAGSGAIRVTHKPSVEAENVFEGPDLVVANRLWMGQLEDVDSLDLTWVLKARVALSQLVPTSEIVSTSRTYKEVTDYITEHAAENMGRAIPHNRRRLYVVWGESFFDLRYGSVAIISLPAQANNRYEWDAIDALPGERSARMLPDSFPLSSECLASAQLSASTPASENLTKYMAWASLSMMLTSAANTASVESGQIELSFVGYKETKFTLGDPNCFGAIDIEAQLSLRVWLFSELSPDRVTAFRHVLSLHDPAELGMSLRAIEESAESLYRTLRSDEIGEVAKNVREANAKAADAVFQAAKASQDLTKTLVDRLLAVLLGLTGVVVANALKNIPKEVSEALVWSLLAFFACLVLIAILVEAPLLKMPIKRLEEEIDKGFKTLTPTQKKDLLEASTLKIVERRASFVGTVLPCSLLGGLAVLCILLVFAHFPVWLSP